MGTPVFTILVCLKENRISLPEYSKYGNFIAEIQVRTILQHAWAEIEHNIQYKSEITIPAAIHRRFLALAGMLERADREFQTIQQEDERLREKARQSVKKGELEEVEITQDALKAYLDERLGPDGRVSDFTYSYLADILRYMGFTNFKEVDECTSNYDGDRLSRIVWSMRQGQITRFDYQLLAGMGDNYLKYHLWSQYDWFIEQYGGYLEKFRQAGITVGSYLPPRPVNRHGSVNPAISGGKDN